MKWFFYFFAFFFLVILWRKRAEWLPEARRMLSGKRPGDDV